MTTPDEMDGASIGVERSAAGVVLRVQGELDLANCDALERAITAVAGSTGGPVTLDLAGVAFLDSSAIHVLIRAREELGTRLRLERVTPFVERVLQIAGVSELLH